MALIETYFDPVSKKHLLVFPLNIGFIRVLFISKNLRLEISGELLVTYSPVWKEVIVE